MTYSTFRKENHKSKQGLFYIDFSSLLF